MELYIPDFETCTKSYLQKLLHNQKLALELHAHCPPPRHSRLPRIPTEEANGHRPYRPKYQHLLPWRGRHCQAPGQQVGPDGLQLAQARVRRHGRPIREDLRKGDISTKLSPDAVTFPDEGSKSSFSTPTWRVVKPKVFICGLEKRGKAISILGSTKIMKVQRKKAEAKSLKLDFESYKKILSDNNLDPDACHLQQQLQHQDQQKT